MTELSIETNVLEKKNTFLFINLLTIFGFIICCIIVGWGGWIEFYSENPTEATPRIWYADDDFINPSTRMNWITIVSFVVCCIVAITYLLVSREFASIQKKKNHVLPLILYHTTGYLAFSRILEAYYIVSMSDLGGLVWGAGQFYYPLDILAFSMIMILIVQVFLAEVLIQNKNLARWILILGLLPVIVTEISMAGYYLLEDIPMGEISLYIGLAIFCVFMIISFYCVGMILRILKKVDEKQKELKLIILLIFMFILGVVIMVISIRPDFLGCSSNCRELEYIFRTIKIIIFGIIALILYQAFVKPSKIKTGIE